MITSDSKPNTHFEFKLSPPPNGDYIAAQIETARQAEQIQRMQAEAGTRFGAMRDVIQRWRYDLEARFGADTLRQLSNFAQEERRKNYHFTQPLDSPERWAAFRDAKKGSHAERAGLVAQTGLDVMALKHINERFRSQFAEVAQPARKPSRQLFATTEDKLPPGVLAGKANPWSIFSPPYAGYLTNWTWYHGGGNDATLYSYVDQAKGTIGHRSDWSDYDAGDADWFSLDFQTAIGMWYKPSEAGRLDIWVKARCGAAHSHVYLDDEFGFSDSASNDWSSLTVNVSPLLADEDQALIWSSKVTGSPDNYTFDHDYATPNGVYWFHMQTSDPIPANVWNFVKVGTRDQRWTILNDVSTYQYMRNMWFVEQVWVDTL